MARKSAFSITFKVDPLTEFADRLNGLTPEQLQAALVDAINETVDSAYDLSRKTILSGINLTDSYVQRKMQVAHATDKKPEAAIVAFGGRQHMTSLSHYGAVQLTKNVNWSNARIKGMGKKFGAWPGWTERKGNAALGIAVDTKAAGRSVEVVKGRRKRMGPAFGIPGKRDNDGNQVVFSRNSAGKIEAKTGPSVYQLFKVAAAFIEDDVADDLQQRVIEDVSRTFEDILT